MTARFSNYNEAGGSVWPGKVSKQANINISQSDGVRGYTITEPGNIAKKVSKTPSFIASFLPPSHLSFHSSYRLSLLPSLLLLPFFLLFSFPSFPPSSLSINGPKKIFLDVFPILNVTSKTDLLAFLLAHILIIK